MAEAVRRSIEAPRVWRQRLSRQESVVRDCSKHSTTRSPGFVGRPYGQVRGAAVAAYLKPEIVALVDGGEWAVVFEEAERQVVAEQFDVHGFGEREVLWERASDPAAWLDAHRDRVAWARPGYEWVLELAGEQSAWSC